MPAPNIQPFLHRANSPIEIPEQAAIVPGPGRVLIRVAKDVEGKYGSLIIPVTERGDRKFYGRVEALSPTSVDDGIEDEEERWLNTGDLVFFGKFSGTELQINRESYIICREADILGIVKDANAINQLMEAQEDG